MTKFLLLVKKNYLGRSISDSYSYLLFLSSQVQLGWGRGKSNGLLIDPYPNRSWFLIIKIITNHDGASFHRRIAELLSV